MKDLCLSFNYCDSERCLMEINVCLSDLDWNAFILDSCTFFNHWLRTKWKPWLKTLKIHFIFYSKHCFLRQTEGGGEHMAKHVLWIYPCISKTLQSKGFKCLKFYSIDFDWFYSIQPCLLLNKQLSSLLRLVF